MPPLGGAGGPDDVDGSWKLCGVHGISLSRGTDGTSDPNPGVHRTVVRGVRIVQVRKGTRDLGERAWHHGNNLKKEDSMRESSTSEHISGSDSVSGEGEAYDSAAVESAVEPDINYDEQFYPARPKALRPVARRRQFFAAKPSFEFDGRNAAYVEWLRNQAMLGAPTCWPGNFRAGQHVAKLVRTSQSQGGR